MTVLFPVSGVETWLWLPPLVGLVVSFFCSMAGISGAFLLMPFQMSVLGYAGPSASATNLIFNLFATPGGVWRYSRDGRMAWPLARLIILGTLPGVVLGYYLRVLVFPDVKRFKLFVAVVLLYLAWRLLSGCVPRGRRHHSPAEPEDMPWTLVRSDWRRVEYRLGDRRQAISVPAMLTLSALVGVIGGTYGIGGGAILAPFCIAVFRLPVTLVAGAALAGTFATSVIGVVAYSLLTLPGGGHASPDWLLGGLFGLGGLAGMYLGAAAQPHVATRHIRLGLGILLAVLASGYLASAWPGEGQQQSQGRYADTQGLHGKSPAIVGQSDPCEDGSGSEWLRCRARAFQR